MHPAQEQDGKQGIICDVGGAGPKQAGQFTASSAAGSQTILLRFPPVPTAAGLAP